MVAKKVGCVLYDMENVASLNGSGKGRPVFVICVHFFCGWCLMQVLTCCGHPWNVNCKNGRIEVTNRIVTCLDHLPFIILSTSKCTNCEERTRFMIMPVTSNYSQLWFEYDLHKYAIVFGACLEITPCLPKVKYIYVLHSFVFFFWNLLSHVFLRSLSRF